MLLASEAPLRTADLGRRIAERLGLALDEEGLGALAALVRLILDSDPTFSHSNRQWDLAIRAGRLEVDRRRPVERAMEDFIHQLGRPAGPEEVGAYIAAIYGRTADYYATMLARKLEAPDSPFFPVPEGRVGLRRWLLDITSDDPEEVEWDNFEDPEALAPVREVASRAKGKTPPDYAKALLRAVAEPPLHKAVDFVVWQRFPEMEPEALFVALLADPELALLPGPRWRTPQHTQRLIAAVQQLAAEPELAAELLATVLPAEEEAAPAVTVSEEDLNQVYAAMERELDRSFRISELCQNVLEAFPGSRSYAAIRDSLEQRMRSDPRFVWVGAERFRLDGTLPSEIQVLPDGLAFDDRVYTGPSGEEVDKVAPRERWKYDLEEQVLHPLIQDVGDDDSTATSAPVTRFTASPLLHHYVAGTLYIPFASRGLLPREPDLVELTVHAPGDVRLELWLNNRLGLLYGLKEWYDANLPWLGGRFHLVATDQPDELRLEYSGEREPLLDLPMDRLQQLVMLRAEAEGEGLPLTEIVTRILRAQPEGVPFVTLFAEVNVVRRVRRAVLAGILSSQRYFTQPPNQRGYWHFDERRAEKATRRKGPRRARAYEEEEELWEEEEA